MGDINCGRKAESESGVNAALAASTRDFLGDSLETSFFVTDNEPEPHTTALDPCLTIACTLLAVQETEPAEESGVALASICFRAAFSRI